MKEQESDRINRVKETRQRLAFPLCLVSGVPAPGQGEARLHHRPSLPSHPSPRRPYLPLMLRSSLPPQSLRAWQDAPRLHLLQMDCIKGRTKHWRVFKAEL